MKKLLLLHEQFIEKANRPMDLGRLPITAREAQTPILPTERWRNIDGSLVKKYIFRRPEDRDTFVMSLLGYERETQHNAEITINEEGVTIRVYTKDLEKVTELDKEYARFADALHRDVVYSVDHGDEASEPA